MKTRIKWVDTAKGIGLILVIIGHLPFPLLPTWVYLFHIPLFFFLSGVVYSGGKYTFWSFTIRKIKTLVVPYFFLGMVIWLFYVLVNSVAGAEKGLYGTNVEMLQNLFIQKHFWTVWFLTALFLTEMIYYVLDLTLRRSVWKITVASVCLCIFGLIRYRLNRGSLPWNLDVAFVAQLFFHFGRVFRGWEKLQRIVIPRDPKRAVVTGSALLGLNLSAGILGMKLSHSSLDMSVGLYGNEVLTFISAFAGILLVICIANQLPSRSLRYLGQNTMIIFAWHSRIVIVFLRYCFEAARVFQQETIMDDLMFSIIAFCAIFAILVPITEIIKKSRFHSLFGI